MMLFLTLFIVALAFVAISALLKVRLTSCEMFETFVTDTGNDGKASDGGTGNNANANSNANANKEGGRDAVVTVKPTHVASEKGPHYTAEVIESGDSRLGRCVYIDGDVLMCERDEVRRHETLVHSAVASLPEDKPPARVLILGGADCGALREILKYPSVQRVVVVDEDEHLRAVCERHLYADARRGDGRVTWVKLSLRDAVERQAPASFDMVLIDANPGRLLTRQAIADRSADPPYSMPELIRDLRVRMAHHGILAIGSGASKALCDGVFSYTRAVPYTSDARESQDSVVLCSDIVNLRGTGSTKKDHAAMEMGNVQTQFYKPTSLALAASPTHIRQLVHSERANLATQGNRKG